MDYSTIDIDTKEMWAQAVEKDRTRRAIKACKKSLIEQALKSNEFELVKFGQNYQKVERDPIDCSIQ